ncbi:DUF6247 family protein [Spongiactinospora sp. TRM90649]|uniref:DUF6247 family protein n=1 Tax=Spongiactinospora sp. TRM90649 TaxID=3031114 RepID=UPI0023F84D21|nr:DUF6247 family protein [Spongiactinospora sp. TRM90649]MDF5758776.1 DUF6247 family protein [Spongiactinospora sp. TRM90649]
MSAQPHDVPAAGQLPDKTLRSIRAALVVPEDRDAFDAGLRVALAEVGATLDLAKLTDFVDTWWLMACDSVRDPEGRREMHRRAARVQQLAAEGKPIPRGDKTWEELLAARGIEL